MDKPSFATHGAFPSMGMYNNAKTYILQFFAYTLTLLKFSQLFNASTGFTLVAREAG